MKTLASMIARTIFAISMEESRFTLNGALLLMRPEGLTMVATDGHRLAYRAGDADRERHGGPAVSRAGSEEGDGGAAETGGRGRAGRQGAVFAGDDNHLFFQLGDRLLITRKLTGNFPDYERVLPKDHHARRSSCRRDEIRAAIERVAQFADERSRAIRVQFTNGEVKVFSPRWKRARAKRASQRV